MPIALPELAAAPLPVAAASAFSPLDWVVLAVYFVGTMALGAAFAKRSSDVEGFTAAGRSLPGWVCGLSIFATYLSSISYLALPGSSFAGDWNRFVFSLALPLAAIVAVRRFVPYYRSSDDVSAYASLERRFGVWARVAVSLFYLLTQIARIAVVMYLMALPMQMLLGWEIRTLIIVTGVAVTLYAMVGGITAVIWADAIQAIVLMVGAAVCLATMLWLLPGGIGTVIDVGRSEGKFSLGSPSLTDLTGPTILVVVLNSLVENLKNFGVDQSYVQRYIASDSDAAAARSVWLGGLLYVPVSAVFFLIGTTLYVFYQQSPGELQAIREVVAEQKLVEAGETADAETIPIRAATLSDADIGDRVFPWFIVTHLPMGLRGLLIAAVFAAAMSTVSTSLNSSATLVLEDYAKRFVAPAMGNAAAMRVLRGATVVWGVIGTGLALLLVRYTKSALDMWWSLSAIFAGAMVGLFLLGLFTRASRAAAVVGCVAGMSVIAWLTFSKAPFWPDAWPANPLDAFLTSVIGTAVILVVGVAAHGVLKGRGDA